MDTHGVRVPLVVRGDGQLVVRAGLVATALGGNSKRLSNGHYSVSVPGITLDMADQSGFATSAAGIVPLPAPATVDRGTLYLPLAVVADVFPRMGSGVLYDSAKSELRVFTPLVSPTGRARTRSRAAGTPGWRCSTGWRSRRDGRATGTGARAADPADAGTGNDRDVAGVSASGDELVGASDDAGPGENPLGGKRYLVVVDAGHGGPDHGMVGPIGSPHTLYEKDNHARGCAQSGRGAPAARDRRGADADDGYAHRPVRPRAHRERAQRRPLSVDPRQCRQSRRGTIPTAARGFETYFLAEAKTEDARRVERMENEAVRFETGADATQPDPLDFIINDMAQNEHLRESSELAADHPARLGGVHPGPDRGVKQAGFRVLVTAYMPCGARGDRIRHEHGRGALSLAVIARNATMANAIAAATAEYLARYAAPRERPRRQ